MNLLNFIPYGKENAVSRAELQRLTGWPDRTIRAEIKRVNAEIEKLNEAILSSSGGRGYWRTSDLSEMKSYLRESDHRRSVQAKNDAPILKIVCRMEGTELVPVRAHMRRVKKKSAEQMRI